MNGPRRVDLRAIARKAMEQYGFEPRFSRAVLAEVDAIDPGSPPGLHLRARDLTSLLWSSIDNWDSEDLDQLEHCEERPDGRVRVRVAIADVDRFVPPGSATDRHAAGNGTSVYTGVETFPMLPDRLSKGISSLLPGEERMAIVMEYDVLPDGSTESRTVYPSRVLNHARLVYEEVGAWLEGTSPVPEAVVRVPGLEEQVRLQHRTTRRMREHRRASGALDLQTIEAEPVLEGETVRDLVPVEMNEARFLIEELMIGANRTLVAFLESARVPMIERVVRVPKYWDGIVELAARHRFSLPAEPDVRALAAFLDERQRADPARFPDLSLAVIKLLGPGEYVRLSPGGEPEGHFGLALSDYTHATAPNRRYVDIVNQRAVKAVLSRSRPPHTPHDLDEIAGHLSDREKAAKKVERFVRKAAAAVLLGHRIGEEFEGLITGASPKGTWVRIVSPPTEGRVTAGETGLSVGDRVRVRLVSTDPYRGFIDFECVRRETW
ncbi:MAG TPA: RNB domain-containing ribonuclease [Methanoregulaceae archaeon]|nr:RNB domain-containing ribonuclease [Methanoregulaceae archaeon]